MAEVSDESLKLDLEKSLKNIDNINNSKMSFDDKKLKNALSSKLDNNNSDDIKINLNSSNIKSNDIKVSVKPLKKQDRIELYMNTSSSFGNFNKKWLYLDPAASITFENNLKSLNSKSGTIEFSDTMIDPIMAIPYAKVGLYQAINWTNEAMDTAISLITRDEERLKDVSKKPGDWLRDTAKLPKFAQFTSKILGDILAGSDNEIRKAYYASQMVDRDNDLMRVAQKDSNGNPYDLYKGIDKKYRKSRDEGENTFVKNYAVATLLKNYMDISSEFSNMFDVFFIFNDGSLLTDGISKDYYDKGIVPNDSEHANYEMLSSRIEKINIPGDELSTFSQKFCGTTVQRIGTKHSFKNIAQLTLRADSGLFFVHLFNQLAGVDSSKYEPWKALKTTDQNSLIRIKKTGEIPIFTRNNNSLNIYVKKTISNQASWLYGEAKEDNKKYEPKLKFGSDLNIDTMENLIKQQHEKGFYSNNKQIDFMNQESRLFTMSKNDIIENYKDDEKYLANSVFPFYIFTNCKFIGSGNSIGLKRESCEPLSLTYQFTFEKCLYSYRLNTFDTANKDK